MSNAQESKIAKDDLRYKRKESSSPFKNTGRIATISYYKYGQQRRHGKSGMPGLVCEPGQSAFGQVVKTAELAGT
jgi:hypothetical protein